MAHHLHTACTPFTPLHTTCAPLAHNLHAIALTCTPLHTTCTPLPVHYHNMIYKIKYRMKSFCYEDVCGSGGPTPRVIQLKVCAYINAPYQFTYAWMLRVQPELKPEWAPETGLTLWGRKIALAVPGGRTGHCQAPNLVRRVSVWRGYGAW